MKHALRVILDTNLFAPHSFDLLAASRLQMLCRTGRVRVIYPHTVVNEVLQAYGLERARSDLVQRWLPFMVETGQFCDDLEGIWRKELVWGRGVKANPFLSPRQRATMIAALRRMPVDGSWRLWAATQTHREIEREKRAEQFRIFSEIRQEGLAWRKQIRYKEKIHGKLQALIPFNKSVLESGKVLLRANLGAHNPQATAETWARTPSAYPYFTSFVVNYLYMTCFAAGQLQALDMNAQADLDILTHLRNADVIVSNESRFMHKAFADLWACQGKQFMSLDRFIAFLEKV